MGTEQKGVMPEFIGRQYGVVAFDQTMKVRAYADEYRAKGFVVVLCDGYMRIHERLKKPGPVQS